MTDPGGRLRRARKEWAFAFPPHTRHTRDTLAPTPAYAHGGTMRTTTTAALTAALLLSLTACTSSSDVDPGPVTHATTNVTTQPDKPAAAGDAALEAAVRAYSTAYFKPDANTTYAMLSTRCKAKITPEFYAPVVEANVKDYGAQEIQSVTVDQLSGDLARVSYTYAVPKLNQSGQPWARESGKWRYDAC